MSTSRQSNGFCYTELFSASPAQKHVRPQLLGENVLHMTRANNVLRVSERGQGLVLLDGDYVREYRVLL